LHNSIEIIIFGELFNIPLVTHDACLIFHSYFPTAGVNCRESDKTHTNTLVVEQN